VRQDTSREAASTAKRLAAGLATILVAGSQLFCGPPRVVEPVALPPPVPMQSVPQDTAPKEEPRLVPPEAYVRTYLELFGGLVPTEVQARARAGDGTQLFDTWADYSAALGFPDYRLDLPRGQYTNAIMVATFERVGIALCDRAVEHDLKGKAPIGSRVVFAFDGADPPDVASFAPKFDVLHRTFLGYPAALAPDGRAQRFFGLFNEVKKHHTASKKGRFSPSEAGWASICYGLIRHPEFHLY
jgi:hypothetical protein